MRKAAVLLTFVAILGMTLLSSSAHARTTLEITAYDAGAEYWFETRGDSTKNPEIVLTAGEEYWVDLRNQAREDHNLHFGPPIDENTELATGGHSLALLFTVPEEPGTYEYWCDPHRELGMRGVYRIEEPQDAQGIPIPPPVLALLLVALALSMSRRRCP